MSQERKPPEKQEAHDLPDELRQRLESVWQKVGRLIDWCDGSRTWVKSFASEVRPYRETFYWESIAQMVFAYLGKHPGSSPDDALSHCLIATQCPSSADDSEVLTEFHRMWKELLQSSKAEIDAFIKSDLELAKKRGSLRAVAVLYKNNQHGWETS